MLTIFDPVERIAEHALSRLVFSLLELSGYWVVELTGLEVVQILNELDTGRMV